MGYSLRALRPKRAINAPKIAATPGPVTAGTPGASSVSSSDTKNTPIADQTAIKIPSTLEISVVPLLPPRAKGAKTAMAALRL